LREAATAEIELNVAEIVTVDGQVLLRDAGKGGGKLPSRIEIEHRADILPGGLGAGRVRIALIKQLPRAGARLRPAELRIDRIA
jgi:hypothetical protein